MQTPNKDTKVAWMAATLKHLKTDKNYTLFTCNAIENACGGEALSWYRGILHQFLKVTYCREQSLIDMFHDKENQLAEEPQNVEARIMWLFMLQTLVQDGQL